MSTFKVAIEEIDSIENHPNADRLETASLKGMTFRFVIAKGKHRVGDRVVYFPLDAMLPQPLIATMGLNGKLGGPDHNVVCTVHLRGFISQGLVEFPKTLQDAGLLNYGSGSPDFKSWTVGDDITEILGVTKYRKPEVELPGIIYGDLPAVLSAYDIEGADRLGHIVDLLMDVPCHISEKLEGCNFGIDQEPSGLQQVLQHTNSIREKEGHTHPFWDAARSERLFNRMDALMEIYRNEEITMTGEIIGPGCEGNHYKLPKKTVYFFDIRRNGQFIDAGVVETLASSQGFRTVPVLSCGPTLREWLGGRTIVEAAHGQSRINDAVLREGIVVKPLQEMRHPQIGRLILKQRDPIYLAKTGR